MNLIIRDELSVPPSWFASFRDLTLFCSVFVKLDIVVESDDPDLYYRWLKPRGGMDFVSDFVRPGSEYGVRLDRPPLPKEVRFPRTVITTRIAPENVHQLIRNIKTHC
jgi:hypothetical protein